jgi:ring-1,2-phenylacetyl-CoA epoxidase subunit PaaC
VSATLTERKLATYALRLGDDALVLSQRLAWWCSRSPEIEEDLALANIALDLLGQARTLLGYAGEIEGIGRDEDALAYLRSDREFTNLLIVELGNGDFALTIARQLLFSTYQLALYERLVESRDEILAGVAGKAVKEVAYHRDHATQWTLRLGDGTEESHRRMQAGLEAVWPFAAEMFEPDALSAAVSSAGVGVDPAGLHEGWETYLDGVLAEATLARPEADWVPTGGRGGVHTEGFGYLIAEMQHLHRSFPGALW